MRTVKEACEAWGKERGVVVTESQFIDELQEENEKLKKVLRQVLDIAMEDPEFDGELFENKDLAALCEIGGAVADWTGLAIIVEDAIKRENNG